MREIVSDLQRRRLRPNPSWRLVSVIALLLLALPLRSSTTSYIFVRILDFDPGSFFTASINNDGALAFVDQRVSDPQSVLVSSGGGLTTIADTSGPFLSFAGGSVPGINDAGAVAFFARLDNGGEGIFTGDGITTTTIADNSGAIGAFATTCEGIVCTPALIRTSPAINNSGQVTFSARLDDGREGIFVGDGASLTTIADTSPSSPFGLVGGPDINDSGAVVFWAATRSMIGFDTIVGIFAGDGTATSTVIDNTGKFIAFGPPTINNDGTVAFWAAIRAQFGGGNGIFTVKDGMVTTIADTSGPFSEFPFGQPAINDAGEVVFLARLDSGGWCLLNGPDPVANRVLCGGDPLLGGTAASSNLPAFWRRGLNDAGQIAFKVAFEACCPLTIYLVRADPPRADLSLSKTDSPDPVLVENEVTYTLTVTNQGPDPASAVVLTDNLPQTVSLLSVLSSQGNCTGIGVITCELGMLAPQASATVTVRVATMETGTLFNTANVAAQERDPDTTNNTAVETTEVRGGADLTGSWLGVSASCTRRFFGFCFVTRINGTFEVRNQGTRSAPSSTLSFFLSADSVLDAGDALLQSASVGPLKVGDTRRVTFSSLVLGPATSQRAIAFVDAGNAVPEADENNNKIASGSLP